MTDYMFFGHHWQNGQRVPTYHEMRNLSDDGEAIRQKDGIVGMSVDKITAPMADPTACRVVWQKTALKSTHKES